MASEHGHTFVVETLLSQRAVLEAKDDYGDSVGRVECGTCLVATPRPHSPSLGRILWSCSHRATVGAPRRHSEREGESWLGTWHEILSSEPRELYMLASEA